MRKLIAEIFLIAIPVISFAQYSTPGTDLRWNLDSLVLHSEGTIIENAGIYLISNDLTISPSDTIKIETNTTIKIYPDVLITTEGVLIATPPDEIIFTAFDTSNNYLGFKFDETSDSEIKKTTIEYGGGIQVLYSDMLFEDCIIRNNSSDNTSGAISLFHSNANIKYCEIYNNQNSAISSAANATSSPQILYNTIYNNTTDNSNRPQINLGSGDNGTMRIVGNTITGIYDNVGGISVATLAGGSIICIIDRNVVQNNRYGINVQGDNITSQISNNDILDNNLETNPFVGGSGISFNGGTTNTSTVLKNLISGNLWGITIIGSALPNFGQIGEDTLNIGQNTIYGNGNSGEVYDLYNNTGNNIMAENNFWGTNDPDTVEMHIFHEPDDVSLGFVDYEPIAIVEELSDEKEITAFSFEDFDPTIVGIINQEEMTILLEVPYGTEINNLVATFTHSPESSVFIGEFEQESGVTANDFISDVIYTVVAEDYSEADYTVHVDVAPNTVSNIAIDELKVFPNPASNQIVIKAIKERIDQVEIYNLFGQKVLHLNNQSLNKTLNVDLSGFSTGIYYLKISSGDDLYNRKIIKK